MFKISTQIKIETQNKAAQNTNRKCLIVNSFLGIKVVFCAQFMRLYFKNSHFWFFLYNKLYTITTKKAKMKPNKNEKDQCKLADRLVVIEKKRM